MKTLILLGIFLATFSFAATFLAVVKSRRQVLVERMNDLLEVRQKGPSPVPASVPEGDIPAKNTHPGLAARLAGHLEKIWPASRPTRSPRGLELSLRRAGLKLRVGEFLLFAILTGLFFTAVAYLFRLNPVARLSLGAAGIASPFLYLQRRQEARRKLFSQQLPDALDLIANSLRSGYSFLQAMDLVSRELPEPIAAEFGYLIKETRVNIPVEEALSNLLERVDNRDLDLVVTAILIQRQIGGNLAEIMEKINGTIRERIRIQGEIRTITAQGRISGLVVAALPIGLAGVLYLLDPGYMGPLFTHPLGKTFLFIGALMQLIGFVVIRRLVVVDF